MALLASVLIGKWLILKPGFRPGRANNKRFTCPSGLHWCHSRVVRQLVCVFIWLWGYGRSENSLCCLPTLLAGASQNSTGSFIISLANLIFSMDCSITPDQDLSYISVYETCSKVHSLSLSLFLFAPLSLSFSLPQWLSMGFGSMIRRTVNALPRGWRCKCLYNHKLCIQHVKKTNSKWDLVRWTVTELWP